MINKIIPISETIYFILQIFVSIIVIISGIYNLIYPLPNETLWSELFGFSFGLFCQSPIDRFRKSVKKLIKEDRILP